MKPELESSIIPYINYIMSTIPNNLTPLEKVRYIYIELGKIFSYNYRIMVDESIAEERINYEAPEISRYQTCYQISEILTMLINGADCKCKANVVQRTLENRRYANEHVATEVQFDDGMKIMLDLTLDLPNIQSGMRTKEFGYTSDALGTYDIISQRECEKMDKKLEFINDKYTDDQIMEFKEQLANVNYNGMSKAKIIDYKIIKAKEQFSKNFKGNHEAVRYMYTLLSSILSEDERADFKQYNLSYGNPNDLNLISIYSFKDQDLYYSYSNEIGLNKITIQNIRNLLNNGWMTNSKSLYDVIGKEPEGKNKTM